VVRLGAATRELRIGLDRIRTELEVPLDFPAPVRRAARAVSQRDAASRRERVDARDIPFVTIDPPGSRDLDQAYFAERVATGVRIRYAIADVAAFVESGGVIDAEARRRGVTLYLPDRRAPLYPPTIGEGAASLLPRRERPALLWTIDIDSAGVAVDWRLEPALVRSRRALTYAGVQRAIDRATAGESLRLLAEVGPLREAQERDRGGVSIAAPVQEVTRVHNGYELAFDAALPVEGWNAQLSLLAGMCAASTMIDGGFGFLRTLPPPDGVTLDRLRRVAVALGIDWPAGGRYPDVVHGLTPSNPRHAAFLTEALESLRGAGYAVLEGRPEVPPVHGAIAAPYAHVTAPLRRLADRFANEIVLAQCAGREAPTWVRESIAELPEVMQDANRRAVMVERAVVDLAECLVLRRHVGEVFPATVIDLDGDRATVQLTKPPVLATLPSIQLTLGAQVDVRLDAVQVDERRVELAIP
jgi:exoribonuclease R